MKSAESPFRPKSSRSFINPRLTTFPQLPSSVYYDQITISSPNLTSFQNYSNIIKSPSGNNTSLVYLKLDNTGIANYRGAVRTPSLKYIFLSSTPLSTYHFYRVMTAIVFGAETLEEIDHVPIKKSERAFSIKYSDLLYPYLIDGWLLTMVDPIRIFDPVTRRRRVLYPPPERRKSLLSTVISATSQKSSNQQSTSDKNGINSQSLQENNQQPKTFSKDGTEFLNFLEKVFFENNISDLFKPKSPKKDDSTILDLKSNLSNSNNNSKENELYESDASLFVNFVLRAAALRPLHVDSIAKLVKEVLTDEVSTILKQSLFHTNFYSNSSLANFIESLLDQKVFTTEDIKPLFFSVYERFEKWDSLFSLNLTEEEQNNGSTFLMVPFIDFFCPFSKIIEKVDPDLYNSLLEQAGENEKERIELYRKNDEKKKEIWKSLSDDDYSKFFSTNNNEEENLDLFTKEQLKQCVIDLTPWDVKEQQIEVAFAFSGSPECLFHSSLFKEDIKSSDLLKVATVAGGSFEIFNKIFENDDKNNSENVFELSENAIRFHRFEMLKKITNSMLEDESSLSSLVEVAIDSMEANAINYIIVDKKINIEKDKKESLLNRAIASSVTIMNNDLNQTSKSHFMNPLNSLLSGYLSLQKAFVIFLYNIGFRSDDSLIFSIQSQSLELVRFFLSCDKSPDFVNRRGWDHLRWTPLHIASNIGNVEIVKELMKATGINTNLRDKDGNTPLMIAVSNNFEDVVKELLKGKKLKRRAKSLQKANQLNNNNNNNSPSVVDPNIADKYGWTPILVAIGNKNASIVQMLLDYNKGGKRIDVNQVAFVNQNDKENENDEGIDDNIDTHSNNSTEAAAAAGSGMTPLNLAADIGDEEIFNLLLKRNDIDVNAKSLGGDSALSIAVKKRNLQFINDLISTKKVKKSIINGAIKVANNLGLTEIAQLLNNFNQ